MLSVIIATLDSERALVRTLAPLVAGAASGIISEVIVADAGSQDETAMVADVAGCALISIAGNVGRRLRAGAATARAPWLLFLQPGGVLDPAWMGETTRFAESASNSERAAVFRPAGGAQAPLREALAL